MIDPGTATLIASGVSAIFQGIGGQSQADAANKAAEAQYKYQKEAYRFNKKTTRLDRKHAVEQWRMNNRNEEALGAWKDATNIQDWNYALKIQDFEFASKMKQYAKSEQLYGQQLTFNQLAQASANEAEYRKLQDATKELAYQNQDIIMKAIQSEGASAVKGQQGRGADKADQAASFLEGNNQTILMESLLSARADTDAAIRKIANDKFGADLAANAARMLKPDRNPVPPKPLTTPRGEFLKPRKLVKEDFGPKPVKGAAASSLGSWLNAGSTLASGIAGFASSQGKYNVSINDGFQQGLQGIQQYGPKTITS